MLKVLGILIELVAEVLRWLRLTFRSSQSIQAENLFLRRQLALYIERGVKPRRIDSATRIALTLLSRLFDWRGALVVVRPETLIRWSEPVAAAARCTLFTMETRYLRPNVIPQFGASPVYAISMSRRAVKIFGVVPTSYPPTPQQSPLPDTLLALLAAPKPPPSASMSRMEMSASSLSSTAVR